MTIDIWNYVGNWNGPFGNTQYWSLNAAPTASQEAYISGGATTLTSGGQASVIYVAAYTGLYAINAATLTATGLTNLGTILIGATGGNGEQTQDQNSNSYSVGGENVTISGAFANYGALTLGNSNLATSTNLTVGQLTNTGTINVSGNATLGTTKQATLVVNSAAPKVLSGTVNLRGDALIQYASGGIQTIASGATLQLVGQQARLSIGAGTSNSALSGLLYNYGTFDLEGDASTGQGGPIVTTTTSLLNGGTLDLDLYGGDGASQMTIGGTLTNTGAVVVGNTGMVASTTLTVANLINQGTINLWGNQTPGTTQQATLKVQSAAPSTWTGQIFIHGDSDVIFASGGIATIASGAEIQIDGQQARYSIGAGTTNSALTSLATNYGTFDEEGDWSTGPGGASVTTNVAFTNYGIFDLDVYNGDGASSFTATGLFTNDDNVQIGNDFLNASSTLTVGSLVNNGGIYVDSQRVGGAGQPLATLNVLSAAPSASKGNFRVAGNSVVHFQSGAIQSINVGAEIELDGDAASISTGSGGSNSALTTLSSNSGTLLLRGGNGFGAGVTLTTSTDFTNTNLTRFDYFNGDGGDKVTFGGVLTNQSELDIGNQYLSVATTVTANSFTNTGSLTLQGGASGAGSALAKLAITGSSAATTTVTNAIRIGGNATLNFGSGTGLTSVIYGGVLELDGSLANVSVGAGAQNSGLANLASNGGTFDLRGAAFGTGGVTLTTNGSFINNGTVYFDYYNGDGGDNVTFGGSLNNMGSFYIGNQYLSATTTVQATSLMNTGNLIIQGNTGGVGSAVATFAITGPSIANVSKNIRVSGNGTLSFASGPGFTSVVTGATLELDSASANVKIGAAGAQNSGLAALAVNQGTLLLRGSAYGAGGVTLTTTTKFTNLGTTYIDYYNSDAGSKVTFGGMLSNSGTFVVGNQNLSTATVVNATALTNTGSLTLQGSTSAGGASATMNISGVSIGTLTNSLRIGGVAKLGFGSGAGFTVIANGGALELDSSGANIAIGAGAQNSGLANLVANNGTLLLRGNSGYGGGGVSLTTSNNFTNTGTMQIDYYNGDGGDAVVFGGFIANSGAIYIGNSYLSAATQVTATGLNSSGSVTIQGSTSTMGPVATLKLTGASASYAKGNIRVGGSGTFVVGTGTGFTGVALGGSLEIDGAQANVATVGGTQNSGLANFAFNYGTLQLRGNSGYGGGGVSVTTSVAFTNSGTTQIDYNNGDGGDAVVIGGGVNNLGTMSIGNLYLSAATQLTAAGFKSTGTFTLQGSTSGGGATASLKVTGVAQSASRGTTRIGGSATFTVGTGSGYTSIAQGGYLELDGSQANVTTVGGTQNSGLRSLSANGGTLMLRGNTYLGSGGVAVGITGSYTNTGTTQLDYYGGDGGSSLSVTSLLTNQGLFDLGNSNFSLADSVTAGNLANNAGQINIYGNASNVATMSVNANATNYAGVEVGAGGLLAVTNTYTQYAGLTQIDGTLSASSYVQNGGATTVNGKLAVASVQESGGSMTFNAALTSASTLTTLSLSNGAVALFNAAVSSSQTVAFQDATDQLNLGAPTLFSGNVTGFVAGDSIDLLQQGNAASVSYSGGVLSVLDSGANVLEAFHLSGGAYTTSSFTLAGDGNFGKMLFV